MLNRLLVIAMTAALAAGMSYAEQAKTITIPVTKTGATNGRLMYGSDMSRSGWQRPGARCVRVEGAAARPDLAEQEQPWSVPR